MAVLVLDSSVAVKWLLDEEHTAEAVALYDAALQSGTRMIAPPLLSAEVTNALYQRQRRGLLTHAQVDVAMAAYLAAEMRFVSPHGLYLRALDLARRYDLKATYDAQYLALALSEGADFWTADLKLVRSMPRSMKWVRWIGDYTAEPTS